MLRYQSPIGLFTIVSMNNITFEVQFNGKPYRVGVPQSLLNAIAEEVYSQKTGIIEWDTLDITGLNVPKTLSEWNKV